MDNEKIKGCIVKVSELKNKEKFLAAGYQEA